MVYLSHFEFPDREAEDSWRFHLKPTCYNTYYPFYILSAHSLKMLDFEPVTILYGGNGSGKSTALNVIAEKLGIARESAYNRSNFYGDYCALTSYIAENRIPEESRIITSDDVFDFMLDIRKMNEGLDTAREGMYDEWISRRNTPFKMNSLDDYAELKRTLNARRKTYSSFVRSDLPGNIREHSNGESALLYFRDKVREDALYLLDEPENSLSPERQIELAKFLEESARFFNCQLIISTHSPFLLAMNGAKIYDLDEETVDVKRWTELKNVRAYYDFFKDHEREFRR